MREPVPGLEAQNICHGDTIQVSADPPHRQDLAVDELVNRFAIELPPLRESPAPSISNTISPHHRKADRPLRADNVVHPPQPMAEDNLEQKEDL